MSKGSNEIPERSPSQPAERGQERAARFLYNLDKSSKRSKSTPPGDGSEPTNTDLLPIAPHVRARLEYERYRTTIQNTSKSPEECEKRLKQLDDFYHRMMKDEREPEEKGRDRSYDEQWKPFTLLEASNRSANEKRKIIGEDEKYGLAPSLSEREMGYQFNEEHMPEASEQPLEDLSKLGIGTVKDLLSYQPNSQETTEATDATTSALSSSNGETTKLYQWGLWGVEALLKSGYVPKVVKDTLQAAKDEFDKI